MFLHNVIILINMDHELLYVNSILISQPQVLNIYLKVIYKEGLGGVHDRSGSF